MKRFKQLIPYIFFISLLVNTTYVFSQTKYPGGWYIELEPFLVKVNDGLSDFQFARASSSDVLCQHDRFVNLRNKEVFGFYAAAGYDFSSCTCRHWGISLGYTYFNKDDHRRRHSTNNEDLFTPSLGLLPFGDFRDVHGNLDTKYHAVDLLAHYDCVLRNCTQVDLFGGLRYVFIDEELNVGFNFTADPSEVIERQRDLDFHFKNDIKGLGPELGVGIYAPFYSCFGITGQISGSWLRIDHDQSIHVHLIDNLPTLSALFDTNTTDSQDDHQWIPAVSANGGLIYQIMFCNCSCLEAELGYRYDVYFKLHQENFAVCDCDCSNHNDNHRFEFQGPYLKLTWHL